MSVRNLEVTPVYYRKELIGYQLQGIHRACSDSLWEPLAHNAIFRTRERAERFLAKVKATSSWNWQWKYWGAPFDHITSSADAFKSKVAPYSVL